MSKEFPGFVENTVQKTAESASIVFEGLQPGFEAFLDQALLLILVTPRLRKMFGRAYARAYERTEKRRKQYSLSMLV